MLPKKYYIVNKILMQTSRSNPVNAAEAVGSLQNKIKGDLKC